MVVYSFVSFPKGVAVLLAQLGLSDVEVLPINVTTMINTVLVSSYPPTPESLAPCLEILRLIGWLITSTHVSLLVKLLDTLKDGLCLWISDEEEVMLETEYNAVASINCLLSVRLSNLFHLAAQVNNVYCRTLDSLRNLQTSLETMIAISPLLASAFVRVPHPAVGPLAFESFWRATYHNLSEYQPFYPDCLKACLMGFADACGGSLGEGLSMGFDSQLTVSLRMPKVSRAYHSTSECQLCLTRNPLALRKKARDTRGTCHDTYV